MCDFNDDIFNQVADDISKETASFEPQIEPDIKISLITDIETHCLEKRIDTILERLALESPREPKCMEGSNTCVEIFLSRNINKRSIPSILKLCRALSPKSYHISFNLKEIDSCKDLYISKGLLIRNVDSNIIIQNEIMEYTSSIIEKVMDECKSINLPQSTDPIHHMMYYPDINPDIPIFLKKKENRKYKSYMDVWEEIKDNRKKHYIPQGALLGYYTKDDEEFCKGAHIVLDPVVIYELSVDTKIPFKVLFTEVLIHELAHVMMDNSKNWPSSLEAKAMEESLANMITLEWFKVYAPEDKKYVKCFIDNWQSSIYKFGIWQDKIDAVWDVWRESKKMATPQLNEWFDVCFANGNIIIPIEDYSRKIYDKSLG